MVNNDGKSERRIDLDFLHVGLPKILFAPVFKIPRKIYFEIMGRILIVTDGHYWINVS